MIDNRKKNIVIRFFCLYRSFYAFLQFKIWRNLF